MLALLRKIADLHQGEERLYLLLALHAFSVGAATSFFAAAATAIFLIRFSNEALLWNYLAVAVISVLLGAILNTVRKRLSSKLLFRIILFSLIGGAALFWGGLFITTAAWLVFTLMAWERVQDRLFGVEWVGVQGEFLTVQQSKRFVGPIGLVEMGGRILTAAGTPLLLYFVSTETLLLIAAGTYGLALIALEAIVRSQKQNAETVANKRQRLAVTRVLPPKPLSENVYLWTILGSVAVLTLLQATLNYGFYSKLQEQFTTEEQLASFTSWLQLVIHITTILARALLTKPLLKRFGAAMGYIWLPVVMIVTASIGLLVGYQVGAQTSLFFAVFVLTFGSYGTIKKGLYSTSDVLLLQIFHPTERHQANFGSGMIVKPVMTGVTGVFLLVLRQFSWASPLNTIALVLGFSLVLMALAIAVTRYYQHTLNGSFSAQRFTPNSTLDMSDLETVAHTRQRLQSNNPTEVGFVLRQFEASKLLLDVHEIADLLRHPNCKIRLLGLAQIGKTADRRFMPTVKTAIQADENSAVRAAALETYSQLGALDRVQLAQTHLGSDCPTLRENALWVLLKYGGVEGLSIGLKQINAQLRNGTQSTKLRAIDLIGKSGNLSLAASYFPTALQFDDVQLQRQVYLSIGELQAEQFLPRLFEALESPLLATTALKSLSNFGDRVIPSAMRLYQDPDTDPKVRERLIQVLSRPNDASVNAYLFAQLETAPLETRLILLRNLTRNHFRPADSVDLTSLMQRELDTGRRIVQLQHAVAAQDMPLLQDALTQSLADVRTTITLILGWQRNAKAISLAKRSLDYGNPSQQSISLEYFDTILPVTYKSTALTLLDPMLTIAQRREALTLKQETDEADVVAVLQSLLHPSPDSLSTWVNLCAIHTAEACHDLTLLPDLVQLADSPAAVIRQAARQSVARLEQRFVQQA